MGEWARDTPWRQGQVLSVEAANAFGLAHPETPNATIVVVISHDCELAHMPQDETVGKF